VLLDEEVAALPETLRTPFLLCCLEGQSYAEAAQQLGLKEGAVRNRLGRARKRLQERLTRRGVALTAVLAAAAIGANGVPAAVPRSLVGTMVKAAAQVVAGKALAGGAVSGKVMTLVEGVNQTMFLNKCKTALLLLACMAILGTGLGLAVVRFAAGAEPGGRAPQAPQQAAREGPNQERPQPADAPAPKEAKRRITVAGQVLAPDGKPLRGAKLYLGYSSPKDLTYPVRATSGDDGRFTLTFPRSELDPMRSDNPKYQVLAVAPGHGCAWATADTKAAGDLTLRLVPDVPVIGRILDADGRPVVGAKLTVVGVVAKGGGEFFVWMVRKGHYGFASGSGWVGPLPGQPTVLTTGADGKFRLAGVGRDRAVGFRLEGPGVATAELGSQGASFEYQAAVSRPIRGVVRDKETGKPLAAVSIESLDADSSDFHPLWGNLCKAVTDRQGRYQLLGLRKSKSYWLGVRPADGLHFGREVHLEDTGGIEALTCDIDVVQGEVTVRGKVTDKATGKPVAGARVVYKPLAPNRNVNNKLAGVWSPSSETTTGPDGSYALTAFPGPGVICVRGPNPDRYMPACVTTKEVRDFFKTPLEQPQWGGVWAVGGQARGLPPEVPHHHAKVLLEPGEKEVRLVRDVALELAVERKGRVVGPDGRPLAGVDVLSSREPPTKTSEGGEFTLRRLNPKAKFDVEFHYKEKNLGFLLEELPDEKAGPLIVKLQPCGSVSGRFVDQDGQPVAGVRFTLQGVGGLTTDKEGRFRAQGLVPGLRCRIFGPKVLGVGEVVVEPGKNKDLGNIKIRD
jgi:protocatechuate 3,4-dioxygenase beta subunit